jgi:CRP-like cAMP-binding protein
MESAYITLLEHIQKRVSLTEEEKQLVRASFTPRHIKKRQFIVQPNFLATHRNYIVSGAFRAYVVCFQGQERTIQLAVDDWWISDYNSYIKQQPATMFVVALEDSIIQEISFANEQKLKDSGHTFERLFRIMGERSTAFLQNRITAHLTNSADKRYEDLLEQYPVFIQRIPQYALASYLGITTEYLSRLRNKKVDKKKNEQECLTDTARASI